MKCIIHIIFFLQVVRKLFLNKNVWGFFLPDPPFHGNKENGHQMIEFIAYLEKNNTLEVKLTWPCGLDCCVLLDILYNLYKNISTFFNIYILIKTIVIFQYFFIDCYKNKTKNLNVFYTDCREYKGEHSNPNWIFFL